MKNKETRSYIRNTAIKAVTDLLVNLPEHKKHPLDAIRMIDRTIGGLLAHKESPYFHTYRTYANVFFPAGLEATVPGNDIILILNQEEAEISKDNRKIPIPPALKNPEKGVAQIIGLDLALELFEARGKILQQLIESKNKGWDVNALANKEAQEVLSIDNTWKDTLSM